MRPTFDAVILAGGASRRMGQDKALLEYNGRTLLRAQVERAREIGAQEIFVSVRPDAHKAVPGCRVLRDLQPGCGPLAGIERGLEEATSPFLLALAVDMPFLSASVLLSIVEQCGESFGSVPALSGRLEPLAAIYPKQAHPLVVQVMAENRLRARDFALACVKARLLKIFEVAEKDFPAFANWNRPEDRK